MAEVEDVARGGRRCGAARRAPVGLDDGPRGQADGRVEVALHRLVRPDPRRRATSSGTRQSTPTTSAPASPIRASSSPVPTPKWMRGTPRSAMAAKTLALCGQHEARVVGRASARRPSCRTAGWPLAPASTWLRSEAMARSASRSRSWCHSVGVAVHHRLGEPVGARRLALDQVAGHRERRPGEADQRRRRARSTRMRTVSSTYGRVDLGLERAQPVEVGGGAERLLDDGSDAGGDVDAEPDRRHRHDDVAVEDGGVDAVAPHRLEGDLGRQVGDRGWRRGCCPSPRIARYSGSDRPAWRMNHTGTRSSASPAVAGRLQRRARRKGEGAASAIGAKVDGAVTDRDT